MATHKLNKVNIKNKCCLNKGIQILTVIRYSCINEINYIWEKQMKPFFCRLYLIILVCGGVDGEIFPV